ncbi:nitrilase-related carbon-nitrogen hydrolase [Thalassospira sp.]|uniref:nitrilase-related carbon-nitrogen hydrolase n=1 Tax=Thalassospira sp. TaxID=1912094 RepID=UPI0027352C1F|nr:nitrilase-related carbon-nitrogen hydrolase [Thalassospira sp.]MDP2697289.1 nitrilase-related carbon-nitrogen hydrolase [Thalassospira sp.]
MSRANGFPDHVSIALWATNLGVPVRDMGDWAAHIDRMMAQAGRDGAHIFVMPEYACEQWMAFKPDGLKPDQEMAWMADQGAVARTHAAALSKKHDMFFVAGSMPWHVDPDNPPAGQTNSAMIFTPEGDAIIQDKLCLTPGEQEPDNWYLTPGNRINIVAWRGLRIAVVICLDIEMPALSCLLAPHGIDIVLVPSMTVTPSGYNRVFGCARARAVELMCVVAACGTTGTASKTTQNPTNYSGCSVFTPCEPQLGHRGIFAETVPEFDDGGDGDMLVARDIPVGIIRALRNGDAEVWPGGWSAGHVTVAGAVSDTPK